MRKPNKKQQSISNFFADTSADLFQSVSDQQAETIKGGHHHEWERYCKKAGKNKMIVRNW